MRCKDVRHACWLTRTTDAGRFRPRIRRWRAQALGSRSRLGRVAARRRQMKALEGVDASYAAQAKQIGDGPRNDEQKGPHQQDEALHDAALSEEPVFDGGAQANH